MDFLKNLDSLEHLNLANNTNSVFQRPIGSIFKNLKLTSLKHLNLESNKIIKFEDNAFLGIENLEVLDLSRNELRIVPIAVTSTLSNLTHLNLSCNKINYLLDNTFENFPRLKYLNFHGNGIESFPRYTFKGLGISLKTLDLSCNKLIGGYFWVSGLRPLISFK